MSEPIDVRERRQLCDLLLELGPDAPTLCEGWTTADLAAHLVLREHFHRWPDARRATEKAKGFTPLVGRLRAGAPLVPWRIPRLREILNGLEFFIHHEDVRRANGREPRPAMDDLEALSWRMAGYSARRLTRAIRPAVAGEIRLHPDVGVGAGHLEDGLVRGGGTGAERRRRSPVRQPNSCCIWAGDECRRG